MASRTNSTWQACNERAKAAFASGDYERALSNFRSALESPTIGTLDQQRILSNGVACRLKLGGIEHITAAVQDAKACVNLQPSWSKAHVRLASAYVALGNHSNDACNALQTALRHDPRNRFARQMLLQELRGRSQSSSQQTFSSSNNVELNEEEQFSRRDPPMNPDYRPDFVQQPRATAPREHRAGGLDEDDSFTLSERLQFYWAKTRRWYAAQSNDTRAVIHAVLALLVLYVAFGGRFGLSGGDGSGNSRTMQGNYGSDNVYEEYRRQKAASSTYQRRTYEDPYEQHHYNPPHRGGGGWSLDGDGLLYIAIVAGAFYAAHLAGISPWQVMMLMQLAGGRRRRFGGGFGGGGFGGRRMRYGRRRW